MSRSFPQQIHRLAGMTPMPKLSDLQIANVEAGRELAQEFIEAVKAEELPPDGLLLAAHLLGQSGPGSAQITRGFFQALQTALARGQ